MPDALQEHGWLVERHDDHFAQDTRDEVLFREIAARGWVFLTQDKKIRSRAPERRELLRHGVRTVSVVSTANLSAAETVAALLRSEAKLADALERETAPFIIAAYKDGSIRRLDRDVPDDGGS